MKRIAYILFLLFACCLYGNAQVTSNVLVQTTSSADFAGLTTSTPLIFNTADNTWYYWNGASFTAYAGSGSLAKSANLLDVASVATAKLNLSLVKADVGLNNVDNTSDANKPISTAETTALALKAVIASPTFTGVENDTGITDTSFNRTITAIGTTGAQTINKPIGTVNFAAGAGTAGVVITNSIVTVNSIVFTVVRTNDTTCSIKNVVPAAGSFTIRMTANCTAATSIGFFVTN